MQPSQPPALPACKLLTREVVLLTCAPTSLIRRWRSRKFPPLLPPSLIRQTVILPVRPCSTRRRSRREPTSRSLLRRLRFPLGANLESLRFLPRFRLGAVDSGADDLRPGRGGNLQRYPEHQVRRRAHQADLLDRRRCGTDVPGQHAELPDAAGTCSPDVPAVDCFAAGG